MENKDYIGRITKYKEIGIGSFSRVYLADYLDSIVAYKEFLCSDDTLRKIKSNIERLTHIDENGIVLPNKLIYKYNDDLFMGYIMPYLYEYSKLSQLNDMKYDRKIDILRNVRKTIDIIHNKYNILHGDICPWNIMYNEEQQDAELIDFDLCIDLDKKNNIEDLCLSHLAYCYSKNNGIDKDLDMFLFNLTTYSFLSNINFNDVLYAINDNNFDFINNNHAINILKEYKDIDTNKVLKKEYVIDYL